MDLIMQKNIARKSAESNSHHESEDFEDLDFNQSVPSNDRVSAESLLDTQNEKEIQTQPIPEIPTAGNQLYKQNAFLKQELKLLTQKHLDLQTKNLDLQRKLQMKEKLASEMGTKMNKAVKQNQEMAYRLISSKQTIQKLEKELKRNEAHNSNLVRGYENKIQVFQEQIELYQRSDGELRKFLKAELKIQAGNSKPMRSVIEAVISDLKKNLFDISEEIGDLYRCVGENSDNCPSGQYNHWRQINRIQKLGGIIAKFKPQLETSRSTVKNLNQRVQELEQKMGLKKSHSYQNSL